MEQYEKNIIPHIESIYNSFTPLEKTIADFFINNTEKIDLSSKSVSSRLYVSEASLSRFAKKCGYKGYREFLFCYEQGTVRNYPVSNDQTKMVLNTYQELLNKSYSLVNEEQMNVLSMYYPKRNGYMYMVREFRSGGNGNENTFYAYRCQCGGSDGYTYYEDQLRTAG